MTVANIGIRLLIICIIHIPRSINKRGTCSILLAEAQLVDEVHNGHQADAAADGRDAQQDAIGRAALQEDGQIVLGLRGGGSGGNYIRLVSKRKAGWCAFT